MTIGTFKTYTLIIKSQQKYSNFLYFGNNLRISVSIGSSAKCRSYTVMLLIADTLFFKTKYVLKRVSFGSKDCSKELKLECAYFLGQTSYFCHLGFISDPLIIVSKFHNETYNPKGQENKIYTIVKGRETFYHRHTVPVKVIYSLDMLSSFILCCFCFPKLSSMVCRNYKANMYSGKLRLFTYGILYPP